MCFCHCKEIQNKLIRAQNFNNQQKLWFYQNFIKIYKLIEFIANVKNLKNLHFLNFTPEKMSSVEN
jgi:hypothetical protein